MPHCQGSRHPLLFYRRSLDRIRNHTFALGVVALIVVRFGLIEARPMFGISSDGWLIAVAFTAFAVCAYAWVGHFVTYIQPCDSYLSVVTPILRFRIGYPRIRSVRPMLIQQVFPPGRLTWAQNRSIRPFDGKTVLIVELLGYPLSRSLLRLFLPDLMFSPNVTGLVMLVPDWMALSTDLDSRMGAWLQNQGRVRKSWST